MATKKHERAGQREVIALRQQQAFALRLKGATYRVIGQSLGISHVQAQADVRAVLDELHKEKLASAEEYVVLENARLDRWQLALEQRMANPTAAAAPEVVIPVMLRVSDARRKLNGWDAPTKVAPTDPSGQHPYAPFDLSALSTQELDTLERLVDKAAVAGGDPGGEAPA